MQVRLQAARRYLQSLALLPEHSMLRCVPGVAVATQHALGQVWGLGNSVAPVLIGRSYEGHFRSNPFPLLFEQ